MLNTKSYPITGLNRTLTYEEVQAPRITRQPAHEGGGKVVSPAHRPPLPFWKYPWHMVKSRGLRWAEHVARMGEERGVQRLLVGKPEGKRLLGRPRRRWEDNIKMDVQEVGGGRGDWVELA
jgi:hypothetical protein